MRCKHCGGEINLSVGRCISCSRSVDDTADIRILHDLGSLAEKYGLDPNAEKYDAVEKSESNQKIDQRTEAVKVRSDPKKAFKPGIELHTYYELLGEDLQPEEKPEQSVRSYDAEEPADPVAEEQAADDTFDDAEEKAEEQPPGEKPTFRERLVKLADRIDSLTEPLTERIRLWVDAKLPQRNRAVSSSKLERLAVVGVLAAALVLVIVLVTVIVASIPENVKGEWRVSDEKDKSTMTVEFSGGEVTARVYGEDGDAYVYKKGTYKTERRNGRDLLTIEYEDGGVSHLYYEIDGKTGHFVNVDTGAGDYYTLLD